EYPSRRQCKKKTRAEMQLGLQGKVAVITGASRGIGNAIAQALLGEDCAVAICSRNASQLEAAVVELSAKGRVLGVATDVTDENAVKRFIAAVIEQFGRIDILVNNAGTHLRGTVETTTLEILDRQLRDKVFGFFTMIKAALPTMKAQRDGCIINIVGQAARHPHPDRFPSGVTNAALMAMSKSVADSVARDNSRVNAVCPQYIESDLLASLKPNEKPQRAAQPEPNAARATRINPVGRTRRRALLT